MNDAKDITIYQQPATFRDQDGVRLVGYDLIDKCVDHTFSYNEYEHRVRGLRDVGLVLEFIVPINLAAAACWNMVGESIGFRMPLGNGSALDVPNFMITEVNVTLPDYFSDAQRAAWGMTAHHVHVKLEGNVIPADMRPVYDPNRSLPVPITRSY